MKLNLFTSRLMSLVFVLSLLALSVSPVSAATVQITSLSATTLARSGRLRIFGAGFGTDGQVLIDGQPSPIADWETKRRWVDYAFEQFQERGYRVASAYTLATTKKPTRFIYTDALWHGGDMIGLGVSSFSHFGGVHFQNVHSFEEYLRLVTSEKLPLLRALPLTPKQRLIREMILQLKTGAIDTNYFERKYGVDVWQEFQPIYERLQNEDLLERRSGTIALTRRGLLQVDHFLAEFFEPELKSVRYV